MEKTKRVIVLLLIFSIFLYSCNNSEKESSKDGLKSDVKRPEKTEPSLRKQVYEFDSKVADISRTLRELKKNTDKGTKITPTIEANINTMIADAKKMRRPLLPLIDSLAEREFGNFNRDKDWIDQLETEWESLRQIK